jgi:type IV pilus assembly protein PilX
MISARRHQSGAALAIGLILLVVLTLLAFTGMNAATTELFMAGNEQHRKSASQAASAGIEQAISELGSVATVAGASRAFDGELRAGSDKETYATTATYIGDEHGLPQSSVDKFVGMHFEIASAGQGPRGATDAQVQGVFVVSTQRAGESASFARISEEGLE